MSGLSGALLSAILAFNSAILGASAAVFGVMLAFAWFWPNEQIYIGGVPVRARVLVIVTTLLTLYSGFRGSRGGVADFAHLGGYLGAFAYLLVAPEAQGAADGAVPGSQADAEGR